MTLITRISTASLDANQAEQYLAGLEAGENLDVCAPCYIKSSDGKVYMSNGTAANEAAEFFGFTPRAVLAGQPVTLFGLGTRFRYGTGLTPGDVFYIGATAGRLDSAPTVGDTQGVAIVVTSTDIVVVRAPGVSAALSGSSVANVANANTVGGIPVLYRINIAAGALGNTDVIVQDKIRVIDVWHVLKGAGISTTTFQVKNGTTAITDAMAASGSDQAVVRAASLNDAAWEIAAGGTLRVTSATGASQPDADVFVLAVRVS